MRFYSWPVFAGFVFLLGTLNVNAQYWQQQIDYDIDLKLDVNTHQYNGTQEIKYWNNSPDTLRKVFFHLYMNAFQPGSMMDVRSQNLPDPDSRVGSRISQLSKDEQGFLHVTSLKRKGTDLEMNEAGTVLEVTLDEPLLPGKNTSFTMKFEGQVPKQIRRNGRDNEEGIDYSMAQWYPKMSEYDSKGWHAYPYVAREFHGVWGDFEVDITIDENYTVAATGVLQNADDIGHGYDGIEEKKKGENGMLTWEFEAEDVIDFVWAADPDYRHTTTEVPDGPTLHFFFQPGEETTENWEKLMGDTRKMFESASAKFGKYPYPNYSVIQGGDGGMEYPMATLITGERKYPSLVGVTAHELMHSWYQAVLATNESLYPWMDEGFTSYGSNILYNEIFPDKDATHPHEGAYRSYRRLVDAEREEPMSTHSDRYSTNAAYGMAAYSKGTIFVHQLGYVIGEENLDKTLKRYFHEWKFKHPGPWDFIRVAEKVSGMQLDWYLSGMLYDTRTVDIAIQQVKGGSERTEISLQRKGEFAMPVDLFVKRSDGSLEYHYIPLRSMRGEKNEKVLETEPVTHPDWPWVYEFYTFEIQVPVDQIEAIVIDPLQKTMDIDPSNNVLRLDGQSKNITIQP